MNDHDLITLLRRLISEGRDGDSQLEDDDCDVALRRLLGNTRSSKKVKRGYAAYWSEPDFKWPTPGEIDTVPLEKVDPCGVEQAKDQSKDDPRAATVRHDDRASKIQQSSTGTAT